MVVTICVSSLFPVSFKAHLNLRSAWVLGFVSLILFVGHAIDPSSPGMSTTDYVVLIDNIISSEELPDLNE